MGKKHKKSTKTPSGGGTEEIKYKIEEFPSPPKKDGTKDPEKILAKKRREAEEAEEAKTKASSSSSSGGKKG